MMKTFVDDLHFRKWKGSFENESYDEIKGAIINVLN